MMFTKKHSHENLMVTHHARALVQDAKYHPNQGEERRREVIDSITAALSAKFPHIPTERITRRVVTALRSRALWGKG